MVNNFASSCVQCRKLIRILALQGICSNRRVKVQYIRSKDNILSDALSRLDFKRFWKNAPPSMNQIPDKLSEFLWPITKVWDDKFDCWNL